MNKDIHFSCEDCGTKYHSNHSQSGKHIKCGNCGKILEIPSVLIVEKKIVLSSAPSEKNSETESKGGHTIRQRSKKRFLIPLLAILIIIVGSCFAILFPIPQLAGVCCLGWWFGRNSNRIWVKSLAELLQSTALGLSILLTILIILNVGYSHSSSEHLAWLIRLDDFLVWSREHLKHLTEISLGIYLSIFIGLLLVAVLKTRWHLLARFLKFQKLIERSLAILVVITSFTFFEPIKMETTVDRAYYKQFRVVVREKLRQERRALIALAVNERISKEDSQRYAPNLPAFSTELKELFADYSGGPKSGISPDASKIRADAIEDVETIMKDYVETEEKDNVANDNWEGSDNNIWKKWEAASQKADWVSGRRDFVAEAANAASESETVANEAVEGSKEAFKKMMGGFMPEIAGIPGIYIEEVINSVAEYIFEGIKAPEIVSRFFESMQRVVRKFDLFGRIASFWQRGRQPPTVINLPSEPTSATQETPNIPPEPTQSDPPYTTPIETVQKRCGRCGHVVSPDAHAGQRCPYCGVLWAIEN